MITQEAQRKAIPVSYTHLDVYKRQEEVSVMEMEQRGEQSISLSMSRIAEMATSAVTKREKVVINKLKVVLTEEAQAFLDAQPFKAQQKICSSWPL